jgi:hypothetical protein
MLGQIADTGGAVAVPPELAVAVEEAVARAFTAVLARLLPPDAAGAGDGGEDEFLTGQQFARRLGVSAEMVRRMAVAGELPWTEMSRGAVKTMRRYPRRFADEFAVSGLGLREFAARWAARAGRAA